MVLLIFPYFIISEAGMKIEHTRSSFTMFLVWYFRIFIVSMWPLWQYIWPFPSNSERVTERYNIEEITGLLCVSIVELSKQILFTRNLPAWRKLYIFLARVKCCRVLHFLPHSCERSLHGHIRLGRLKFLPCLTAVTWNLQINIPP